MSNFKRGRPKHQRAGCLCCKPHKDERAGNQASLTHQELTTQENVAGKRRPNRRKWCKGKAGVPHQPKWEDLRRQKGYLCFRCQICGKELDSLWSYRWLPSLNKEKDRFLQVLQDNGWPRDVVMDRFR